MNSELLSRISDFLCAVGYEKSAIEENAQLADQIGYASDDEALSIVAAGVVYGADEAKGGKRFPVEPGSW